MASSAPDQVFDVQVKTQLPQEVSSKLEDQEELETVVTAQIFARGYQSTQMLEMSDPKESVIFEGIILQFICLASVI